MSTTTAQSLKLDYFKFYLYKPDVRVPNAHFPVYLKGQFDSGIEADLTLQYYFANPARKNGEPIYDPNAHLTFYKLTQERPEPQRLVQVENQFGRREIRLSRSFALLAPAQKIRMKRPEFLAHFKLYQVLQPESAGVAVVELGDQFVRREKVRIKELIAFGVPVIKKYRDQTFGIENKKAHLMIYRITSIEPSQLPQHRGIRDQFSGFTEPYRPVSFVRSYALAVPTIKLEWKEL